MSNSTLCAHSGATKVSLETLAALPTPMSLGKRHAPIAHIDFVSRLKAISYDLGLNVAREEYAIQNEGLKMFGIMDFSVDPNSKFALVLKDNTERGLSLGFRTSNDKTMKHYIVGGSRVFVCDNMCLSGNAIVLGKKHTHGYNFTELLSEGMSRLLDQYTDMEKSIQNLKDASLTDTDAKAIIYDAFIKGLPAENEEDEEGLMTIRMMPDVHKNYFKPENEWTDCTPRNKWGLYNAFTRAIKDVKSPRVQFDATRSVGKFFGVGISNN